MAHVEPRFEFRIFARDLAATAAAMEIRCDGHEGHDRGTSTYLLSRLTIETNAKIRDGRIEVKRLRAREGVLELWEPAFVRELPVSGRDFANEVAAPLGLELDLPDDVQLTAQAIADICAVEPALACLDVERTRQRYMLGSTLAEYVLLRIDGTILQSIAVESARPEDVLRLTQELGIGDRLNEGYAAALQHFAFDRA